jgi:hypothetical protein
VKRHRHINLTASFKVNRGGDEEGARDRHRHRDRGIRISGQSDGFERLGVFEHPAKIERLRQT